ncbi:hypothetical protein Fmac_024181 [Flemingia macrophylla]|uniref:C2H2-type domain-containing protein n=1 Tax=Flemingia macrophylla TaxID=520843 RepID=A0ABD1LNM2_9FABA
MNSEKPVSPENLSEENDNQEEANDGSGGTRRSYECTFCRRGFTNAQALGGHMNIHRRDRAKAKQFTPEASSLNKFNNDETMALPFVSETLNQPIRPNYAILESQRNNTDMHFRSPPPAHAFYYEFYNQRTRPSSLNQELRGANLSLQIGPSNVDEVRRGNQKDSEVDLELRLGHDPY